MDIKSRFSMSRKLFFLVSFAAILSFSLIGCEKTKEEMEDTAKKIENTTDNGLERINNSADSLLTEKMNSNFMVAEWHGKFDNRSAVLSILEQNGNEFSGKIIINYRNVITQEVKGQIEPAANKVNMEDQLHSRFKGKYNGSLSDDKSKLTGVFTTLADGKKFNFSFEKK